MICPKCGGGGKVYCTMCKGTGLYHEEDGITNEEWLCSCTTEEKAKVLYNFFMARTFCHICPENEVEDFIMWLKQPHKGE